MKSLDSFCFKENFKQCDNLYINYSPILGVAFGVAPGHAGVVAALGVGLYEGVWAVWLAGVVIGCDGVIIGVIIGVPIGYKY